MISPVTKDASFPHSQHTVSAMSFGSDTLGSFTSSSSSKTSGCSSSGMCSSVRNSDLSLIFGKFGSFANEFCNLLEVKDVATPFTRIPWKAISKAAHSMNEFVIALATEYAVSPGKGIIPDVPLNMHTLGSSSLDNFKNGIAKETIIKVDLTLIFMHRSHCFKFKVLMLPGVAT